MLKNRRVELSQKVDNVFPFFFAGLVPFYLELVLEHLAEVAVLQQVKIFVFFGPLSVIPAADFFRVNRDETQNDFMQDFAGFLGD